MPEKELLGYMQVFLSEEKLKESIEWHKRQEKKERKQ